MLYFTPACAMGWDQGTLERWLSEVNRTFPKVTHSQRIWLISRALSARDWFAIAGMHTLEGLMLVFGSIAPPPKRTLDGLSVANNVSAKRASGRINLSRKSID